MDTTSPKPCFLIVDDEPDILESIERLFRDDYTVLTARTPSEALELAKTHPVEVVMSDQRMAEMSGIEFLMHMRQQHPDVVRVVFTGFSNLDHVIDAINKGHVYRYIRKPWRPNELKLLVAQAFEHGEFQRERRALVESLRAANQKLEHQNTQLSEANEALQVLDRVKNVFMEVVSHELNTPIAVILGYVFLLQKEMDSDRSEVALKALSGIDSSALRLKNISKRIFKMLSSDEDGFSLEIEKLDVREFVDEVHGEVIPFLRKRNQTLHVDISEPAAELWADRSKLHDVVVNLLMNAIKFSRDGQQISMRVTESRRRPGFLRCEVVDHGVGIPNEDIDQIFEAFFSTFQSINHSSGDFEYCKRGIGLGLTVARRFTEMHGGEIEVSSKEGEGSRFAFEVPRGPENRSPTRAVG